MADYPALPLWTDAYLADTRHLTTHEHGAYLLLLMCAWRTPDCGLPDDDKILARMAGMNVGRWRQCRGTVLAFWHLDDDGRWRQKRLTNERSYVQRKSNTNRKNGSLGGQAKALKNKKNGMANGTISLAETQGESRGESLPPTPTPKESSIEDSSPTGRVPPAKPSARSKPNGDSKSSEVWRAYSHAYEGRYGAMPIRNAKVNSQLCQMVDRIGAKEAPDVAAFYLSHNGRWYTEKGHSVHCLLNDCEKLRTEWATNRQITSTRARQVDRTASNFAAADEAVRIRERMAESADDLLAIPPFLDRRAAHAS